MSTATKLIKQISKRLKKPLYKQAYSKNKIKENYGISKDIHPNNFYDFDFKTKENSDKIQKRFKLSDFDLCSCKKSSQLINFGTGTYLSPEVCRLGPDSTEVGHCSTKLILRLICLNWIFLLWDFL